MADIASEKVVLGKTRVVPFFDDLLSLIGALVNHILTHIISGFMLLFLLARKPTKAS